MTTDYTVDAHTRTMALFRSGNAMYHLKAQDFSAGVPHPYALDNVRNTSVKITATGPNYRSVRTWFYTRDDLQLLFNEKANSDEGDVVLDLSTVIDPNTTTDLLAAILQLYGVKLLPEDVVVENMDGSGTYTIKAAPGSYGFIGQITVAYDVSVDPPNGYVFLVMNNQPLMMSGKYLVVPRPT